MDYPITPMVGYKSISRTAKSNSHQIIGDAMIQGKKELANLTVASGKQWITELSDQEIKELVSL